MHYKEDDLVSGLQRYWNIGLDQECIKYFIIDNCSIQKNYFLNYLFPFSFSSQVKRTLFIHGINKYAEESQIKLHFE